ncbi:hypothetical protein GLAREA_10077 [Glarea lozoyensis ATCC 20868]|uniref:Uncharacterized protein n=1 Tax=Glarea lozoyensis (strain ATCC 20868 / MF5171) TaxID=1116229 RepID=S3E7S4_GLAL2|nr:uncharacterized protein GLAREA_10077 [Glarea lozoyensis ATCC 20868]EPE34383.1 hypothetical protein GLAREA_10077 [Glarea lozoyensis ATCC 20868]
MVEEDRASKEAGAAVREALANTQFPLLISYGKRATSRRQVNAEEVKRAKAAEDEKKESTGSGSGRKTKV